jgi:hypothetical protein
VLIALSIYACLSSSRFEDGAFVGLGVGVAVLVGVEVICFVGIGVAIVLDVICVVGVGVILLLLRIGADLVGIIVGVAVGVSESLVVAGPSEVEMVTCEPVL